MTWKTAYHDLRRWRQEGTWKRLPACLRERLRGALGREAQPTAGIIDSQRVKTTGVGGDRGDDGAQKITGRKRHLRVDTHGRVRTVEAMVSGAMGRLMVRRLVMI